MLTHRKIPNKSPGLIEAPKHFSVGLYSKGLIYGGSFGLTSDLSVPKNSLFVFQTERLTITFSA